MPNDGTSSYEPLVRRAQY